MRGKSVYITGLLLSALLGSVLGATSFAAGWNEVPPPDSDTKTPAALTDVGIHENLGQKVSIGSLHFKNEKGEDVLLKDYFKDGHPVLLTLVYYECPNLCSYVLTGLVDSLRASDWTPGKQFDVVVVSINPDEKPDLAARRKQAYLLSYGKPETANGWHFLTGEDSQIRRLASEVGYSYKKDGNQYAHGAALYALTPEGRISRYLYGIEFKPTDLKLSLLEASSGKIGTIIERMLLFCYRYDPVTRRYSFYLYRVMKAGGAGTMVVFGAYMATFWRREYHPEPESEPEKKS